MHHGRRGSLHDLDEDGQHHRVAVGEQTSTTKNVVGCNALCLLVLRVDFLHVLKAAGLFTC